MKKTFFLLLLASSIIFISCSSESGGMSETAKKNIAINDSITQAYQRGDFSKMGDYIAADAVDHAGEKGDVVGLDSIVADMKRYHEMMPDMKILSSKSLADDEYVYTWAEMKATMMGKEMTIKSVDIAKFKDGKAVEHWMYMDPKDMAAMMESMPPQASPTGSDAATTN